MVESPSLKIFKTFLDVVLGDLLWVAQLEGGLDQVTSRGAFQPQNHSTVWVGMGLYRSSSFSLNHSVKNSWLIREPLAWNLPGFLGACASFEGVQLWKMCCVESHGRRAGILGPHCRKHQSLGGLCADPCSNAPGNTGDAKQEFLLLSSLDRRRDVHLQSGPRKMFPETGLKNK